VTTVDTLAHKQHGGGRVSACAVRVHRDIHHDVGRALMRRSRVVICVVLGAGLLGVSACAGRPAGPDPSPAGLDPLQPTMPAWAADAIPAQGVALDRPEGQSMPWLLAAIASDRRTITVAYVGGDGYCVKHLGHTVDVEGTTMVLTEYSTLPTDRACEDSLSMGVETISLPLALDDSVRLVHAPAAQSWTFPA
jgi:hypothetical protein